MRHYLEGKFKDYPVWPMPLLQLIFSRFTHPYDGDILFAGSLAPTGSSSGFDISMNLASVLPYLAGMAVKKSVLTAQGK
jgi:hypothetical protein